MIFHSCQCISLSSHWLNLFWDILLFLVVFDTWDLLLKTGHLRKQPHLPDSPSPISSYAPSLGISIGWKLKFFSGLFWVGVLARSAVAFLSSLIYVTTFKCLDFPRSPILTSLGWSVLCLHCALLFQVSHSFSPPIAVMSGANFLSLDETEASPSGSLYTSWNRADKVCSIP